VEAGADRVLALDDDGAPLGLLTLAQATALLAP